MKNKPTYKFTKQIIFDKIDNEGLSYWLTDYFDYIEIKTVFGKDIADKCKKVSKLIKELEDWYSKERDKME